MPEHVPRDKEATRAALSAWLAVKLPDAKGLELSEPYGPFATGFSNETIIVDATWKTPDGEQGAQGFVFRPKPVGHTVFMESEFEAQYRVLELLQDSDVIVPRVRWFEDDPSVLGSPFFVMDKLDGRAPEDTPTYHQAGWLHDVMPEERATMWWSGLDQMIRIHTLDPAPFAFLDRPARGTAGLDQQLAYYREYFAWTAKGRPHPTVTDAQRWLDEHRPTDEPTRLVWGDSRVGNILFGDDCRPVAVVDWEMVTLGNPVEDLAWWIYLDRHHSEGIDVPRLEGFPSYDDTVARWENGTGLSAGDLDYYLVFAGYRFSVVMMRVVDLIVEFGYMPDAGHGIDNTCSQLLAKLLELPPPCERG